MTTIHLPGREPLLAFFTGDGRLIDACAEHSREAQLAARVARAGGYREEEYFASDFDGNGPRCESVLRAAVENWIATPHAPAVPDQPTDTRSESLLNLVMAQGRNRPTVGYLISDADRSDAWLPCLRVAVVTHEIQHSKNARTKLSKDHIEFTVGHLRRTALAAHPVTVSTKRTVHQPWLTEVWKKVCHAIGTVVASHSAESDFVPVETSSALEGEPRKMLKLAILLHSPHWAAIPISDEAKRSELELLGLKVPRTRNDLGTTIKRMEIKVAE
jgi:hypothetical protein